MRICVSTWVPLFAVGEQLASKISVSSSKSSISLSVTIIICRNYSHSSYKLLDVIIQLQGTTGDESHQYKLNCCLSSFKSGANSFCSALSTEDPFQFAKTLAETSDVIDESISTPSNTRKRKSGTHGQVRVPQELPWYYTL